MFERERKIITGKGKVTTVTLLATAMASAPISAYGFEMKGEYHEVSCQEVGVFTSGGTTVKAGITGQLMLSKLEGNWASKGSIRTMDVGVITAKVVTEDSGLNMIEYTVKTPGKAQSIVVVESGAAADMGIFYVIATQDGGMIAAGWIQENR